MDNTITISKNDLASMEASLQTGIQICNRLKKQLGPAATGPSSRKGLNAKDQSNLLANRRKHIVKSTQKK